MNGVQASLNEGADINYNKVNTHIHIKHSFLNNNATKLNALTIHVAVYQEIFASLMFCVKGNLKFCKFFCK